MRHKYCALCGIFLTTLILNSETSHIYCKECENHSVPHIHEENSFAHEHISSYVVSSAAGTMTAFQSKS
jgi:hypothetical protein